MWSDMILNMWTDMIVELDRQYAHLCIRTGVLNKIRAFDKSVLKRVPESRHVSWMQFPSLRLYTEDGMCYDIIPNSTSFLSKNKIKPKLQAYLQQNGIETKPSWSYVKLLRTCLSF